MIVPLLHQDSPPIEYGLGDSLRANRMLHTRYHVAFELFSFCLLFWNTSLWMLSVGMLLSSQIPQCEESKPHGEAWYAGILVYSDEHFSYICLGTSHASEETSTGFILVTPAILPSWIPKALRSRGRACPQCLVHIPPALSPRALTLWWLYSNR